MSSKTFPTPPANPVGAPSEEEQEILKEIDLLIQKSPQELAEKPLFKPKKSGVLVPLLINLMAGGLVAGGIFGAQWYFGVKEADLRQRPTVTYESAEGQVLEQIMAQSRSQLEAKNREIQGIQDQLKNLGADQNRWKAEAQTKIEAKKAELQKITVAGREEERRRLVAAGASPEALAQGLQKWEAQAQAKEKAQLESFQKEIQAQLEEKNRQAAELERKLQAAKAEELRIKSDLESASQKAKPLAARQALSLEEESQTAAQIQSQSQVLLRGFAFAVEAGDLEKAQRALGDLDKLAGAYLLSGSDGIRTRAQGLKNAQAALESSLGVLKTRSGTQAVPAPTSVKEDKPAPQAPVTPAVQEKPGIPVKEIPAWEKALASAQTPGQKTEALSKALKTEPVLKEMASIIETLRVQQEAADLEVSLKRVSAQLLTLGPDGSLEAYLELVAPPGSPQAKQALARDLKTLSQRNLASLRNELTKTSTDLGIQLKEKEAKIAALEAQLKGAGTQSEGDAVLRDQLRTLQTQRDQEQAQLKALGANYQRARDLALTRISTNPASLLQAGKLLDQARDTDFARSLIPSLEELFQTAAQAMTEVSQTQGAQSTTEIQQWKERLAGLEKAQQETLSRAETAEKSLAALQSSWDALKNNQAASDSTAQGLATEIQNKKNEIQELKQTILQQQRREETQIQEVSALQKKLADALNQVEALEASQKVLETQKVQLVQEQKEALKKAADSRRAAFQDVLDFVAYLKGDSASATQSRTQIEAKAQQDEDYQKVLQAIQALLKSGNRETLIRNEKTLVLGPLITFSGDLGQVDSLTGQGKLGQTIQIRRVTSREEQILAYGVVKKLSPSVEIQSTRPVPGAGSPRAGDIVFLVIE